ADVPHVFEAGERRGAEVEHQNQLRIFQKGFESVRRLGFIADEEAASHGGYATRGLQIERPDGHIDNVAPEVYERSAGIVPELPKTEVATERMIGAQGRRSQPEIVVQLGRSGRRQVGR